MQYRAELQFFCQEGPCHAVERPWLPLPLSSLGTTPSGGFGTFPVEGQPPVPTTNHRPTSAARQRARRPMAARRFAHGLLLKPSHASAASPLDLGRSGWRVLSGRVLLSFLQHDSHVSKTRDEPLDPGCQWNWQRPRIDDSYARASPGWGLGIRDSVA